jgi:hypothetical protein
MSILDIDPAEFVTTVRLATLRAAVERVLPEIAERVELDLVTLRRVLVHHVHAELTPEQLIEQVVEIAEVLVGLRDAPQGFDACVYANVDASEVLPAFTDIATRLTDFQRMVTSSP